MPYIVKRNVTSLGLKVGDVLKHEEGKLPSALKFDADWHEPKAEEPKAEEPKAEEPKAAGKSASKK